MEDDADTLTRKGGGMNKIIIDNGSDPISEMILEHGFINIGRARDNDIQLHDETLSGHHARIVTIFTASHIEDTGSTNGTFVNDKKIIKHTLHDGDIITLGNCHITFSADVPVQNHSQDQTMIMSDDKLKSMLAEAVANKQSTKVDINSPSMKSATPVAEKAFSKPATPVAEKAFSKPATPVAEKAFSKPVSNKDDYAVETRLNPSQANQNIYQPEDDLNVFNHEGMSKRSIILVIATIGMIAAFAVYILKLL